jgi:magnesium chelatase family protein
MLFKTISASVYGIDAYPVEVEVDVGTAYMKDFNVVGLPDNAVKESRERIKAALRNCGFEFPYGQGVTINLAPADVRKEGSGFDLPMALGVVGCQGQFFGKVLDQMMFLGELSLDGSVRPVRGALSATIAAREKGLKTVAAPENNAREAAVVEGIQVFALKSVPQAVDLVNSPESFTSVQVDARHMLSEAAEYSVDLRDVHGQQAAKRALEVACAGGHNILFIGPPGAGKTMLAKGIPTILPPLSLEEAIETTRIHSVAGTLDAAQGLIGTRPFRSPHRTISDAGLIGGGAVPRPGEVSLGPQRSSVSGRTSRISAQRFGSDATATGRRHGDDCQGCRLGQVFFQVHAGGGHESLPLTPVMIQRYISKISGPLLGPDRYPHRGSGGEIQRVACSLADRRFLRRPRTRDCGPRRQSKRFEAEKKMYSNAQMASRLIRKFCAISQEGEKLLENAVTRLGLSARAHDRILKVARTIADLEDSPNVLAKHLSEAIQYRTLDRDYWA